MMFPPSNASCGISRYLPYGENRTDWFDFQAVLGLLGLLGLPVLNFDFYGTKNVELDGPVQDLNGPSVPDRDSLSLGPAMLNYERTGTNCGLSMDSWF